MPRPLKKTPSKSAKIDPELGQRVRQFRVEFGMTGAELARKIGVDQSTVSQIEIGRNAPSVQVLKRLCEIFECSSDVLIFGEERDPTLPSSQLAEVLAKTAPDGAGEILGGLTSWDLEDRVAACWAMCEAQAARAPKKKR